MFEALEKAIREKEKLYQSKDLYYQSEEHKQLYSACEGIPFYKWDYLLNNQEAQHNELAEKMHGRCCFNHLIGLPEKHGVKRKLYEYEYNLFVELMKDRPKPTDSIVIRQQHKHLAVIKATGLGAYCVFLKPSSVVIVLPSVFQNLLLKSPCRKWQLRN